MQTITFIGNGNMGLSIAQGLKEKYNIDLSFESTVLDSVGFKACGSCNV